MLLEDWIIQQDSAPTLKSKLTQEWLEENIPNFKRHTDCQPGSPNLNPVDYNLWDYLEQNACSKCHPNLEPLKRSIEREAAEIPLERIGAVIAHWLKYLAKCIPAQEGHF